MRDDRGEDHFCRAYFQQFQPVPHQSTDDTRICFFEDFIDSTVGLVDLLLPCGDLHLLIRREKVTIDGEAETMHDLFRGVEIMMEQVFMLVEERRGEIEPRGLLLFSECFHICTDKDGRRIPTTIDSDQDTIDQIARAQTDQASRTHEQHLYLRPSLLNPLTVDARTRGMYLKM